MRQICALLYKLLLKLMQGSGQFCSLVPRAPMTCSSAIVALS
jgi:hypothetical protein